MFGGPLKYPKPPPQRKLRVVGGGYQHLAHPSTACSYGHMGRAANSDYHIRLLHYKQRTEEIQGKYLKSEELRLKNELQQSMLDKHTEHSQFQTKLNMKVQKKLEEYEASIVERRKKLIDLLAKEEIEYYQETVITCQKGEEERFQEMKEQVAKLIAQREAERLEIVKQKRFEHYMENTPDLRPILIQQNLLESKEAQKIQMWEKQMKKEAERELDRMWYELMLKELKIREDRERQDLLKQKKMMCENIEIWNKQLQTKAKLKEEEKQIVKMELEDMIKIGHQPMKEVEEEFRKKREKREKLKQDLLEQIRQHQNIMEEQGKKETEINHLFGALAAQQLAKEQAAEVLNKQIYRKELKTYMDYLRNLKLEREREETEWEAKVAEAREEIMKKQQDARCAMYLAKQQMQKDCVQTWEKQVEYNREIAKNQLKMKEADNELLKMCMETNERLQKEHERLVKEAELLYRKDLTEQITQNKAKKEKEQQELHEEYLQGLEEERKLQEDFIRFTKDVDKLKRHKHPFRRALEEFSCKCEREAPYATIHE